MESYVCLLEIEIYSSSNNSTRPKNQQASTNPVNTKFQWKMGLASVVRIQCLAISSTRNIYYFGLWPSLYKCPFNYGSVDSYVGQSWGTSNSYKIRHARFVLEAGDHSDLHYPSSYLRRKQNYGRCENDPLTGGRLRHMCRFFCS